VRRTRTPYRPAVVVSLFVALIALAGCHRALETTRVVVEESPPPGSVSGAGVQPVSLTDLGRRPAESEARVVPLGDSERPFRYRVEPAGSASVSLEGADPRIVVTVQGEIAGGIMTVETEEHRQRYSLDRTLLDNRKSSEPPRYRLSFPLGAARSAPWEVEFTAHPDSSGYVVEEIRFGYAEAEIIFPERAEEYAVRADSLLPVILSSDTIRLPVLGGVIRDHTHALLVEYHADRSLFTDRTERPVAGIELETESGETRVLELRLRPGHRIVPIRPGRWLTGAGALTLTGTDSFSVRSIRALPLPQDPEEPILIDLEELQQWPRELWRRDEFELFSWSAYPRILWTKHHSYETQARMFKRLAFFVEKRGYQGSLLTNEQLRDRHGWNAHNYRPEGLAEFFNAADDTGFLLNREELLLREIAVRHGLLVAGQPAGEGGVTGGQTRDSARWLPGTGGVLSISEDSFPALKRLLTVHEAMHGVFYEEPAFRRTAYDYWDNEMTQRERDFWQFFFSWMSYDPADRYLMVNEFQAYLLQQGEASARWYFGERIADRLRRAHPTRSESIDLMLRDHPDTFLRAAAAVNEALFQEAGMIGGDPFCLRPLQPPQ
jgi:hypothetical protein